MEQIERARSIVPTGFPLMLDCWMALDVPYALRLAQAAAGLGVRWIEEPLPEQGVIRLSRAPGFGLELADRDALTRPFPHSTT